jgi:two-component system, OmpR family, sensor histidine kinase VicK
MENLNGRTGTLRQLKAENRLLRDENQQLRAEKAAAQRKLEQEQAIEKEYQQSQSRFQSIFYESKLGNKIIGPDLKIIQINAALQVILGYSAKEIVGTKITQYAHPDFVHHWQELQESLWTQQIPSFQFETCLIKKDGSNLWCQVTSILIPDQATTLGYTIVEDINQRKRLELELQKLYDNQETIMHMIVHDLKSYLFNIKLLNDLMQEQLVNLPAGEMKDESLSIIRKKSDNCDQALAIINDILLIGRLESVEETFEKTDLKTFIQKQLTTLELGARKKGIQVNYHYPEAPVYARIIPKKFIRVLENLLANAIKFTPAGGQVTISLKNEGKKALLQVSDTGIGIPEHLQGSIFQKFTKANRVGTAGEPTTGLGLYIVKQIVEKHKGKIWVESKENAGSTFFIQLS